MKRAGLLLGLLLSASCTGDPAPEPVSNRCNAALRCASGDVCHPMLGLCVREAAAQPYRFVVQAATSNPGLVTRTWSSVMTLGAAPKLAALPIRKAVRVHGKVLAGDAESMEPRARQAEVAFFPRREPKFLSTPVSAFTHLENGVHVFMAWLDPATTYDVRVFPLGRDSLRHPPHSFTVTTTTSELENDLSYPETVALMGRLEPETRPTGPNSPLAGLKARLRHKARLEFVSSVTELTNSGSFELFVTREVSESLNQHELVIDLRPGGQPWGTTLAIDGSRLTSNRTTITVPDIPDAVSLGVVLKTGRNLLPTADFTFVSDLQPPPNEAVRPERDWCRLRSPGTFSFQCSVRMSVPVDGRLGKQSVLLLPGYYKIFVAPNTNTPSAERVATKLFPESVLPQPGGLEQGPVNYELEGARLYAGKVVSPLGKAMPLVTVTATALNIRAPAGDEVEAYNRTAEDVSDGSGAYVLAFDRGAYDLSATAPEGTGFPRYSWANRQLGEGGDNVTIAMESPVLAEGRVVDEQGVPVYQARVEAFAVVPDQEGERPVRIASTESSDAGTFTLLLPPRIDHDPLPPSGLDGGLALRGVDAGLPTP